MDKVLKQRLIGASILIALAVIFLPMLFDGGEDERTPRQLALDLPERPANGAREVRRLPLDPDQARTPPPEVVADPPEEAQPVPDPDLREPVAPEEFAAIPEPPPEPVDEAPAEPAIEIQPEPEALEEPEPEPTPDVAPAQADGDWVVQVAVFGSRDTAQRIRQRLDDLGHAVSLDVLSRDQSDLYRLRTGPYASREDAETARGQIAATVAGVDPAVRSLGPAARAAAVGRAGYAVQVGSFASRSNADRLVAQLRDQGQDAFIHSEESGGRTIHRVRVGSFDEREAAEALQARLSEEAGLEGIVVSHP